MKEYKIISFIVEEEQYDGSAIVVEWKGASKYLSHLAEDGWQVISTAFDSHTAYLVVTLERDAGVIVEDDE